MLCMNDHYVGEENKEKEKMASIFKKINKNIVRHYQHNQLLKKTRCLNNVSSVNLTKD